MSHISELKRTKREKQVQECFPTVSEGLQCCLGEWTRMKSLQQEKISISRAVGDRMWGNWQNLAHIVLRHVVIIRLSSRCETQLMLKEAKINIFRVRLGDDVSNVEKLNFLTLNCWKGWNTNMKRSRYRRLQQWFIFCGESSFCLSSSASSYRFIFI